MRRYAYAGRLSALVLVSMVAGAAIFTWTMREETSWSSAEECLEAVEPYMSSFNLVSLHIACDHEAEAYQYVPDRVLRTLERMQIVSNSRVSGAFSPNFIASEVVRRGDGPARKAEDVAERLTVPPGFRDPNAIPPKIPLPTPTPTSRR